MCVHISVLLCVYMHAPKAFYVSIMHAYIWFLVCLYTCVLMSTYIVFCVRVCAVMHAYCASAFVHGVCVCVCACAQACV